MDKQERKLLNLLTLLRLLLLPTWGINWLAGLLARGLVGGGSRGSF